MLTVAFNKAIDPSTFTSSEVTITGPNGAIPTGSITVTEVDAAHYTVTFPQQTQQATYAVSIGGPGVHDISGNAMTAAYLTSFIIDLTAAVGRRRSPRPGRSTTWSTAVDVTFNKPIDASTLNAANITLTGPGGAIAVGQGYLVSGTTYRIPFATQRANGAYQLTIGAGVQDLAGTRSAAAPTRRTFTMSLPDLVVSSVTPSATSAALRRHDHRELDRHATTARRPRRARGPTTSTSRRRRRSAPARSSSARPPRRARATLAPRASYNGQATVQLPVRRVAAGGDLLPRRASPMPAAW